MEGKGEKTGDQCVFLLFYRMRGLKFIPHFSRNNFLTGTV